MRVIVTGSRAWADKSAVWDALNDVYKEHGPFVLVHGACSTGADAMAHEWWLAATSLVQVRVDPFPANWKGRGKAAGPERNQRMIEAGADLVLAFPLPEGSGTQMTMDLARKAGIEVREYGS